MSNVPSISDAVSKETADTFIVHEMVQFLSYAYDEYFKACLCKIFFIVRRTGFQF